MLKMLRLHIGEGDSEELVNIEVDVEKESFSDSVIASQFPEVQVTPQQELVQDTVSIVDIDTEPETKSTEHMSPVAISEEELIPPSQVSISTLEPSLQLNASTVVCEDSQSVFGCAGLFNHQETILKASYAKTRDMLIQKSTSITDNQVTHQLFGKRSQAKERLKVKKKRKGLKSWRFKYKQGSERLWRLHNRVFSFLSLCDNMIDRLGTTRRRKLFGGLDDRIFGTIVIGEAHKAPLNRAQFMQPFAIVEPFKITWAVQRIGERETDEKRNRKLVSFFVVGAVPEASLIVKTFRHKEKMGTKKTTRRVKSWMFKFRKKKSGAGHGKQSVYDWIILVMEQLMQTGLIIQELMGENVLQRRRHKTWSMLLRDCFKEDDLVYHEPLPIWALIRFKFWKFKFLNRNLQKPSLPTEKDMDNQDEMFIVMSVLLLLNGNERSFRDKVLIQQLEWGDCAEDWTQEVSVVICFILRRHLHLSFDCVEHVLARRKRNHGLSLGLQTRCFTHYAATWAVQKIVGKVAPNVERFQIKHKWRFKLLPSIKYKASLKKGLFLNSFGMVVLLDRVQGPTAHSQARDTPLIKQFLLNDESFKIKHKWSQQWRFPCNLVSFFSTNLEVKVS
ncbi:PREDICTED: uncharacterized protein LOC109131103 [Camelina sativa]|uniref:Uncharacterized protein LOC109131103 n=1 Tax=Camelina sativa TaxID=90675 RepID=A0ABM1RDR2_CAMSA|nr:PREDICTED: uncharacterized protein LOC109131103 [Camelina sativa]